MRRRRGPYRPRTYLGQLRERAGLTQQAAARRLGLRSRAHLSALEHGLHRPSAALLARMARVYGVRQSEVLRLVSLTLHLAFIGPDISGLL